jgi:hypothetical protein
MLDELGQLGVIPWTYRGWLYLFSSVYRDEMKAIWSRRGNLYKAFDISLALVFAGLEILIAAGITVCVLRRI